MITCNQFSRWISWVFMLAISQTCSHKYKLALIQRLAPEGNTPGKPYGRITTHKTWIWQHYVQFVWRGSTTWSQHLTSSWVWDAVSTMSRLQLLSSAAVGLWTHHTVCFVWSMLLLHISSKDCSVYCIRKLSVAATAVLHRLQCCDLR